MLRSLILKAIDILGINRLISFLYRNHLVIFMLHGVIQPGTSKLKPSWTRHTLKEVETILGAFGRRYNFISMDEAVDMINGTKPWKKYCMVITIDDGYLNSLEVAYPAFKSHNAPMTIYATVNNIDKQRLFWVDKLDLMLNASTADAFNLDLPKAKIIIDKTNDKNISGNFNSCLGLIKQNYTNDYDLLRDVDEYAESASSEGDPRANDEPLSDISFALLKAEHLSAIPSDIVIGSHMLNHVRCTHIPADDLIEELSASKTWIEAHTGKSCHHFCYPNGDYNSNVVRAVKDAGYTTATTTVERSNKKGDNPFTLHRFPFPHASSRYEANYRLSYNLLNQSRAS